MELRADAITDLRALTRPAGSPSAAVKALEVEVRRVLLAGLVGPVVSGTTPVNCTGGGGVGA